MLRANQVKLDGVNEQSIHKLIAAGYDISIQEYEAYENDVTRGGWKALNLLIDKGFCRDVGDYFDRLFVGDMALTMPAFAAPEEAVRIIHQAGGLAICAHPGHNTYYQNGVLLERLLDRGIDGLECLSPYHDQAMTQHYLEFCRRNDLLITAGSDCHGGFARRSLGIPRAYVDDLNLGPLLNLRTC
jgi:predicted metal-dependent phosphoesterase TrpH